MALSSGVLAAIILGVVGVLGLACGIQIFIDRRRLREEKKKTDIQKAERRERAMQKKATASLHSARSTRPSSPTPSYVLSPTTSIVDWSQRTKEEGPLGHHSNPSKTSITSIHSQRVKQKPSPLRLQVSEGELTSEIFNGPLTSFGKSGGAYLPPPSPRSFRSPSGSSSPVSNGWVSPLDVHFTKANALSRPTSYLPRLQFPDTGRPLLTPPPKSPTPSFEPNPASGSPVAAVLEPVKPASPTKKVVEPAKVSPTFSLFPAAGEDERPSSKQSNKSLKHIHTPPIPPIPTNFRTPSPSRSPFDGNETDDEGSGPAVFRDSIVSKRIVSIYQPRSSRLDTPPMSPLPPEIRSRTQRGSATSVYSARTSIVGEDETSAHDALQNVSKEAMSTTEDKSPFSNKYEISTHSASQPTPPTTNIFVQNTEPMGNFKLELNLPDRNRLFVEQPQVARDSIGDFYDAYYRQSMMAKRASEVPDEPVLRSSEPSGPMAVGKRSPSSFRLDGVVEVITPVQSPAFASHDRYPRMI